MRSAFQHFSARAAIAVTVAGLIAAPATAASAAAAVTDCAWHLKRAAVPEGLVSFWVTGTSEQSFVGSGQAPDYGPSRAVLWTGRGEKATVLSSPGGGNAVAMDVNNHDVVVANDQVEDRPYLWARGRTTRLGLPTGTSSAGVNAINDSGVILGWALIGKEQHGLVWSARSPHRYRDLGVGDGILSLSDVDEAGTIVATTRVGDVGRQRALKGTVSGGLSPLLEGEGIIDTYANTVNGPYVLGGGGFLEDDGTWNYTGVVWHGDSYTKMPTNYGLNDVNSSGVIAGGESVDVGPWFTTQAAVWKDGVSTLLPTYLPNTGSYSSGITEDDVVIGTSWSTTESDFNDPVPVTWTCS